MQKAAVFARNHLEYLEGACDMSDTDPSRLVTFRSSKSWKRAKQVLDEQETVKIYFAPVGGEGIVEYAGTLKALVLNPKMGEPETVAALGWDLPGTKDEGLWENEGGSVRTLYLVSNCRRLPKKFPITDLVKLSDGAPISPNYGYSYVPVMERTEPSNDLDINPEEISEPEQFFEGAVRTISVNAFERNSKARAECLAHYGYCCAVCGFDFEDFYGAIGKSFIHVHHIISLSDVNSTYQVNPVRDLLPVCPNCHAMIHKRIPPYSLEEMKHLLNGEAANG